MIRFVGEDGYVRVETFSQEKDRLTKIAKGQSVDRFLYGLKTGERESMEETQEGKCSICLTKPKKLFVDHDHVTGKVRGLLCRHCNFGIGHFKDNIAYLKSAIEYLEKNMEKPK